MCVAFCLYGSLLSGTTPLLAQAAPVDNGAINVSKATKGKATKDKQLTSARSGKASSYSRVRLLLSFYY